MLNIEEFSTEYNSYLSSCNLTEYKDKCDGMYNICTHLDEANKQFNLTAIRDGREMLLKHIIDSLIVADKIRSLCSNGNIIDVGSGAGFPSLPIACALDAFKVTAIDSTTKKVNYINDTARQIGFSNITAVSARAEDYADKKRESFDVATARAVARLPILIELCVPFVKVGGVFVAIKGETALTEAADSKNGAEILGVKLEDTVEYTLPSLNDKRYLLIYRKVAPTDKKYPRNYSQISKKPL